jgi:hypothetical protein
MTHYVRCTCNNNTGLVAEQICREIEQLSADGKLPALVVDKELKESPVIALFKKYNIMEKCCRLRIMTVLPFYKAREF